MIAGRPADRDLRRRRLAVSPILLGCLLLAGFFASLAASTRPARAVTCVANASNISFGSLAVTALTGAATTGTIYEGCAGGFNTSGNLTTCNAIGAGSSSASQTNRTMKSGANAISYQLYSDNGTTAYAYPGADIFYIPYTTANGGYTTTTTYAKILSSSAGLPPGTYTDTYTTTAQTYVDFHSTRTLHPSITCGVGPNQGLAAPFTVSVTVLASCSIAAATLNFGTAGVLSSNIDATTNLSITCTNTTGYSVSMGAGTGAGATTASRSMPGAVGAVQYALYRDSGRTLNWGNTTTGASPDVVTGVGTGAAQSVPVYGRVPPQTTPRQGAYSDTVIMTVSY